MMQFRSDGRARLLTGLGIALAASLQVQGAQARDCLLDTNNDGVATASTDTDGGAESANQPDRLACGPYTSAGASGAVAVGVSANAGGAYSLAAGYLAAAYQRDGIAVGNQAQANARQAVAVGAFAVVNGSGTSTETDAGVAMGYGAYAEEGGVALGRDSDSRGGTAVGRFAFAAETTGSALGTRSVAGTESVAVGDKAVANFRGVAIGSSAEAPSPDRRPSAASAPMAARRRPLPSEINSTAIGAGSVAEKENAVALGANSLAEAANTVVGRQRDAEAPDRQSRERGGCSDAATVGQLNSAISRRGRGN